MRWDFSLSLAMDVAGWSILALLFLSLPLMLYLSGFFTKTEKEKIKAVLS